MQLRGYAVETNSQNNYLEGTVIGFSKKGGTIGSHRVSWLEDAIVGPATLSWGWSVSSGGDDYLEFYYDGVEQFEINGTVSWERRIFIIPSDTHTVRWEYDKDGSTSSGSDCGCNIYKDWFNL
jgi:hypothetical protein